MAILNPDFAFVIPNPYLTSCMHILWFFFLSQTHSASKMGQAPRFSSVPEFPCRFCQEVTAPYWSILRHELEFHCRKNTQRCCADTLQPFLLHFRDAHACLKGDESKSDFSSLEHYPRSSRNSCTSRDETKKIRNAEPYVASEIPETLPAVACPEEEAPSLNSHTEVQSRPSVPCQDDRGDPLIYDSTALLVSAEIEVGGDDNKDDVLVPVPAPVVPRKRKRTARSKPETFESKIAKLSAELTSLEQIAHFVESGNELREFDFDLEPESTFVFEEDLLRSTDFEREEEEKAAELAGKFLALLHDEVSEVQRLLPRSRRKQKLLCEECAQPFSL
jgi:hypothetical protein